MDLSGESKWQTLF
eukprot:gene14345-15872_t